jgi:hypothetical protein
VSRANVGTVSMWAARWLTSSIVNRDGRYVPLLRCDIISHWDLCTPLS